MKYFRENQTYFDKANERGGLFLFLVEIGPWNAIKDMGSEVKTLRKLHEIMPENENINYLLNLSEEIKEFDIKSSDIYIYSFYLFNELHKKRLKRDIKSFSTLASWFARLNKKFDIVTSLDFDEIWDNRQYWNFEELSLLMYEYHILKPEEYNLFINQNIESVIKYLKVNTDSINLYEVEDDIYIEYLLLPQDIGGANTKSVNRINAVCRFLPIYQKYITKGIKPEVDLYSRFNIVDESHKAMPIKNIKLRFNTDLTMLWKNSILSHYEVSSIYEWQEYWKNIRSSLINFYKLNIGVLESILKQAKLTPELRVIDDVRLELVKSLGKERLFPREIRPFEKPVFLKDQISKIKSGFFSTMQNYINNYLDIAMKKTEKNASYLAMYNLKDARNKLKEMQMNFREICEYTAYDFDLEELENQETLWLDRLIILNDFYLNHMPRKGGYSRLEINEWNKEQKITRMRGIQSSINSISDESGFSFVIPKYDYCEENLTYLPVGVKNVDIKNEQELGRIIVFISFLNEIDVTYIELLFLNDNLEIIGNALRISKSNLKKLYESLEKGCDISEDNMFPPLPVEVNQKQLDCFEEDIKVIRNPNEKSYGDIEIFLTYLWEYYQYQNYFDRADSIEGDFLVNKNKINEHKLDDLLQKLKDDCDPQLFIRLNQLKRDVIENKIRFSDIQLNEWLNNLVKMLN